MKIRTSLRYRVTLAFALLGLLVSLSMAASLYVLIINTEERLVAETLSADLDDYITRFESDQQTPPPSSTTIRTYVIQPDSDNAPEVLRTLDIGLHQIEFEGKGYYAEVKVSGGNYFIVLYADKQIRHRENQFKLFLGIGILTMTILSAVLGFWLSSRITSPVRELAISVAGLRPEDHPAPLATDFTHDEVGELAQDFDAYLQRLSDFIEREQSFTADVSHELRTPLAVIKGATEILLADQTLGTAQRKRIERIARSAHEMTELVTALLLLAREEQKEVVESGCAVAEALQYVVEGHQHLLHHKPVKIKLDIKAKISLPVECILLRVVLANLIRNAIYFTERGHVSISLDENGISVMDTGIGIPKEQIQKVFDRYYKGVTGSEGIGLSLVKRICQCYGWTINLDSQQNAGTVIRLSFQAVES